MGARALMPTAAVGAAVILMLSGCGNDEPDSVDAGTSAQTTAVPATATTLDDRALADDDGSTGSQHQGESAEGDSDAEVHERHDAEAGDDEGPSDPVVPEAAPDDEVDLVIPVVMLEFGYEMPDVDVTAGSTVRFDFVNDGAIVHEAMLGDAHQQDEFATEGGHDGGHAEADHHGDVHAITLEAGESGSLVVNFDQPGEMMIGCHIPGHWDAGMAATFTVS